ncbi:hypothetical protein V6N13_141975 [Hibiscus sabdariffa]
MEQARLDCYSFQDQLSMFHLLLCKCFDKLLKQDDKGDVSNRDNGSCPGLLSAETCTPSRLCVLGLRIGSADRLGPWFDTVLVQWCLEKYADHIALPVVFSLPAEVGVSAGYRYSTSGISKPPRVPVLTLSIGTPNGYWNSEAEGKC